MQVLSNYYALDDGTPEDRIYLNNNQTGFVAQRFETFLGDTLKAIRFFFNRVNDGMILKPLVLMVWRAGSNVPGELVLSQEVIYPTLTDDYNKYFTYALTVPVYLPAGTYYFGWAQTVPFEINLGFDRNMANNDRIFYNLDGTWYNYTAEQGTLMIQPLFRKALDIYVGNNEPIPANSNWKLYPNPANDFTTFQQVENSGLIITLTDIAGRIQKTKPMYARTAQIETSELPSGIYIVTATDIKTKLRTSKLLLVQH